MTTWTASSQDAGCRAFADRLTRVHLDRFVAALTAEISQRAGQQVDLVAATRRISGNALVDF